MKKILIIFLIMTLILLVSCNTARTDENINEVESATQTEIEGNDSIEIDSIDFVGMTYGEVKQIMGTEGELWWGLSCQWPLDDGRILKIWLDQSKLEDQLESFKVASFLITAARDESDNVDFDTVEIDDVDFTGMTYAQLKRIFGSDGESVGSGAIIYQWELDDGRSLKVWFGRSTPEAPLDEYYVGSFSIEPAGSETVP